MCISQDGYNRHETSTDAGSTMITPPRGYRKASPSVVMGLLLQGVYILNKGV